ncbi:type IV pilus biogenesis/stability protein PilW [Kangiella sediminilitoris]|uniref:Type IV pilus biogenesis/stability protein PilW n=1 Tax=Kangiella sediminilitoris TaxID=1144748 RepID=A0A1B3BBX9_9GAMM|nr:type IV pilus biogenesis/stability protein PilW [Kangiella sediminilitoris]AOE50296.1 Type IV pilus biogenesis/stability protein PilW [Kangiella sediminilitoris]
MNRINWIFLAAFIFLTGCQTTSKTTVSAATNDGIEVPKGEADKTKAAEIRLALGLKYIESGYMERAKQNLIKAYEHRPDMPDVLYGLGYYYQSVYEYDKADRFYLRALDETPDNPDYLNGYGAFLCESKKEYAKGIEYFLEAIDQPEYTSVGEAYENAGFCSISAKQYEQASEYFEKALTINPNLSKTLYGLAMTHYERGNARRASDYLYRFEGKSRPTPNSLLLGYKVAKVLNHRSNMRSYGEKLMQLYPNSQQANEYLTIR